MIFCFCISCLFGRLLVVWLLRCLVVCSLLGYLPAPAGCITNVSQFFLVLKRQAAKVIQQLPRGRYSQISMSVQSKCYGQHAWELISFNWMDTKTMKSNKIKCSNPCLCCENPPSRSLFKPRLFLDYLPEYPYMLQSWAETAKDSYRTEASCFNINIRSSMFNIISFLGWKIPKVLQILTVNQRASENMVDIWLFASKLTSSTDHPRPELRPKATFMFGDPTRIGLSRSVATSTYQVKTCKEGIVMREPHDALTALTQDWLMYKTNKI